MIEQKINVDDSKILNFNRNKMKRHLSSLLFMLLFHGMLQAQKELDVISNWIQFSDAPNSLYHDLASQAYDLLEKRNGQIADLHSLADWQNRQKWIKKTLLDIVGPFPERTPLYASIVRTINKEGYKVENIVFQSQPGFYVTSSLFIPANSRKDGKTPAIIYCSGHTDDGYRNPVYQQAILNLVKKGFIVFAFDPIGQGERYGYFDPETGKAIIGERDEEHSYAGAQPFITGSSLAMYMIWDGIRAVDYLVSRKEVDPHRIGMTGRSGGGTQSAYIAAFDDRIKAIVPENYITNFKRLIQSSGPQCAEQDFFNGIKHGIDIPDLLLARAPKPALMIATTRDLTFSIQGAVETGKQVSRIYEAYKKKSDFNMVTDDAPHASTKKGREAMYAFFQKYLDNPGDSSDNKVQYLSPKELQVTKTGQVSTTFGSETVFTLNKKASEKLINKLQVSRQNFPTHIKSVVASAKRLSGYQPSEKINEPVFTGRFQKDGYVIEKYFVKGEGNYVIPYLLMKPDHPNHKALIYLNPSGKSAGASPGGDMEWFVKNGFTVLAPDLLGIGEIGPGSFHGDSYIKGVSYNIWFLSMLIGKSIVGIQTSDVLSLVDLLKKNTGTEEVYGVAIKEMSPVLLHAAAFDTSIRRVALIEPYSSYRSIVTNRFYNPAYLYSTVPGALQAYDLPDLEAALAPRNLMIAGMKDGTGKDSNDTGVNEDLSLIRSAYHDQNANEKLKILPLESTEKVYLLYKDWIR
jgi:hypothetical protein